MQGAYGGSLAAAESSATEPVPPEIAALLELETMPSSPGGLVPIRSLPGKPELEYRGDLRGLSPLEPQPSAPLVALKVLARALPLLEELHASGRAHGDLLPAHVLLGGERVALTFPAKVPDAARLLRARLASGAPLADVGFSAPEVLEGKAPTPESDVFSAAALVHFVVSGRTPHGAPSPLGAASPALARLETVIIRALASDPAKRPSLASLRAAVLEAAGVPAAVPASADAKPVPIEEPEGFAGIDAATRKRDTPIILGCLLAFGGVLILLGAFWLVAVSWDAMGQIGHLALLILLTAGTGTSGAVLEARGYARSGFALVVLTTQLLWPVGGFVLDVNDLNEKPGPWALNAGLITLATFGLAVRRSSILLSILGSIAAAVALLCLGGLLGTGSDEGPATWCLVCALGLSALSAIGLGTSGDRVGAAPAGVAAVFLVASSFLGFVPGRNTPFWTFWPYVPILAAVGAAYGLSKHEKKGYSILGLATAGILAAVVPSIEALAARDPHHLYEYVATGIGTALIILGFKWEPAARDDARKLLLMFVGLPSVAAGSAFKALERLIDRNADDLLMDILNLKTRPDQLLESPLFHLSYVVGTATVLVALGLVFARDAEKKWPYRILEVVGLLLFFGTLTILSVAGYRQMLYPALLFGGGAVAIVLGARERHLVLVFVPAAFLLLDAWIQYFGKLADVFPLGLLLIGFGLGLVIGGVVLERTIRPRIGELKTWG